MSLTLRTLRLWRSLHSAAGVRTFTAPSRWFATAAAATTRPARAATDTKNDEESITNDTNTAATKQSLSPLDRASRRYFAESWRFRSFARQRDMKAALAHLVQSSPPYTATVTNSKRPMPKTDLDRLSQHPYATFLSLMRTFASHGDVDGCYILLTKLHQIAMTNTSVKLGGDLLSMVMTAHSLSSTPSQSVTEHRRLFDQFRILKAEPTLEFYHSLMILHSQRGSIQSFLADLASLASTAHPPTIDAYVNGINHWGLVMNNKDSAIQIFLSLSSLFLPNSLAFNALIAVLANHSEYAMAQQMIRDMVAQRQTPTAATYASLIRALANNHRHDECWKLYDYVRRTERGTMEAKLKTKMRSDMHCTMIEIASERDSWDEISRVWNDLLTVDRIEPNVHTVNQYIEAAMKFEHDDKAREGLSLLLKKENLNSKSFLLAFELFATSQDFTQCQSLFEQYLSLATKKNQLVNPQYLTIILRSLPNSHDSVELTGLVWLIKQFLVNNVRPSMAFVSEWLERMRNVSDSDSARAIATLVQTDYFGHTGSGDNVGYDRSQLVQEIDAVLDKL